MKTIFGLFENVIDAHHAIHGLEDREMSTSDMNIIVQEETAKNTLQDLGVDMNAVKWRTRDDSRGGLVTLLAGQQAIELPDAGEVYAAGQIATVLAKTASDPDAANGGLEAALRDFDVQHETAAAYRKGVDDGGALLFVRTSDEQAGAATNTFRKTGADHVTGV